ncbi:MAG: TnsA endonuclease N-terminal domain-containing protein [Kiritimatiellae bacterium]|nr:TnsA endonuclease N-terminal domain-containing protein [Kiritimatiellia bacterium]
MSNSGGTGGNYKPWLTIQDVPSRGRTARPTGWKTGRLHHLLSDIETAAFYLLDWDDHVLDIREQYPLDREKTRQIAAEMGVAHPADVRTKVDIVMTTDFLVDIHASQGKKTLALAVKMSVDLDDARTVEKLEIERRYWQAQETEWGIVTEQDMNKDRVANIRWVHEMHSIEGLEVPHPEYWQDRCRALLGSIDRCGGMMVKQFMRWLESSQGFASGEGLTVIRHLIATKVLAIDMDRPFDNMALLSQAISVQGRQDARRRA